jgi:dipeptidyl aminopeptidase/acylaminoacyl peptidase
VAPHAARLRCQRLNVASALEHAARVRRRRAPSAANSRRTLKGLPAAVAEGNRRPEHGPTLYSGMPTLRGAILSASVLLAGAAAAQTPRVPTVDDLLTLKTVGGAQMSPDGRMVAYTVSEADFEQDAFVTHLWVAPTDGRAPYQLTRGAKSATSPRWSPDGQWLAFSSARVGDRNQIFVIRPDGGEALQLTKADPGVNDFAWSPDGRQIAYVAPEPESPARKARKQELGDFERVHHDYTYAQIWTLEAADALRAPAAGVQRTRGQSVHPSTPVWSPDGARLAFSGTTTPDLIDGGSADLYVLTLATNTVTKVVGQPGPDTNPRWSPDGSRLAFESAMGRGVYFHANGRIAIVDAGGGTPRSVTDAFDEDPALLEWKGNGLYFSGGQKTAAHLFRLDVDRRSITRVSGPEALIGTGFTLSRDGEQTAFTAASPTSMAEVFVSPVASFAPRKLTAMTAQLASLIVGTPEVVSWKSKDDTTIEGVLIKPAGFDPTRKYPLLVQIHGGPTGVDRPVLLGTRTYPSDVWVGRGALVLKVNYRGSAGYGEKFRQLNVRNLGVGDAWDVVSGVEALTAKGWADPTRVGCMGWSQGGYISAFLTTSTTLCKAVSVGAGISNWATYYYNTDITPFTIQYLGDDPVDDPEIYRKTSPMSYIKSAKTPTLIQHGELDRRVPIPNAYELRQGLEDRGVSVEMIVYKGFGHGVTKPRAARAVMRHNLEWFNHHLWGDPLPDFAAPALATPESTKP